MSLTKHRDAQLIFEGPLFPESVDTLNKLYDTNPELSWSRSILENIRQKIQDLLYFKILNITTSDNYTWFMTIFFNYPSGQIILAIPWKHDIRQSEGSQMDRSIAVYKTPAISEQDVNLLITTLIEKINRLIEESAKKI